MRRFLPKEKKPADSGGLRSCDRERASDTLPLLVASAILVHCVAAFKRRRTVPFALQLGGVADGRAILIVILPISLVLLAAITIGQSPFDHAKAIAAAKRTQLHDLDPTMKTRQPLETWLIRVSGSRSKLSWEVNDCGEATGSAADAGRDLPICVEARARVSRNREMIVSIAVGTNRTGVTASRELAQASLTDDAGSVKFAKNLSELALWVRDFRN